MIQQLADAVATGGGPLGFDEYMQQVLYAPRFGYYSHQGDAFGPGGDFTTAPEYSALYGACLARQCQEILAALPGASLLELGAGSGALAAVLMRCLAEADALPQRYLILEPSAALRARQQTLLRARLPAAHYARLHWLQALPQEPLCGIILANEVLDALPVCRFVHSPEGLLEQGVTVVGGQRLQAVQYPARAPVQKAVDDLLRSLPWTLPFGYCSEISLWLAPWLASLADCLQSGVMLFIDYGCPRREYYHPQRSEGTLLCHYRHRAHDDPLLLPGLQDITAWVDFTALALAAEACGLRLLGYTTQVWFLLANDLQGEMEKAAGAELPSRVQLAHQARVLSLPGEMGERFKVIACGKDHDQALRGFALRDQRHFLHGTGSGRPN